MEPESPAWRKKQKTLDTKLQWKKKKKEENTFGGIVGYDSDAILMNKAIHKFFGHSEKYSQRKGSLKKKIRYQAVMKEKKEKKKEIPKVNVLR